MRTLACACAVWGVLICELEWYIWVGMPRLFGALVMVQAIPFVVRLGRAPKWAFVVIATSHYVGLFFQ